MESRSVNQCVTKYEQQAFKIYAGANARHGFKGEVKDCSESLLES